MSMLITRLIPIAATLALSGLTAGASVTDAPTFEQRLERLVERLEREREEAHIPGMALAIVRDDVVVLARGFGLADVEDGRAVTPETLFAIGSSSKAFTATLIGMLVDEGKMDWDDPIVKYLPYFTLKVDGAGADDRVTLRDLLSHRTGFTRMSMLWGGGRAPRETILRTAAGAEPWSGFREKFYYNNVMFLAAGVASAEAAGTDWDNLLRERLLVPLGMDDSNTSVRESMKDPRLAQGYAWDAEQERFEPKRMLHLDSIAPAGAINSNVLDMAQWVRLQLGRGEYEGARLISAERHAETWTPQMEVGRNVAYGLGWFVREWNGRRVIEHGGNIDGFAAEVALLPESNLGFVLLTNVGFTPFQLGSIATVFEALVGDMPEETQEGSPGAALADRARYVGEYVANFAHFKDAAFTVLVKNDRLAVDVPGQMVFELKEPDADGKRFFVLTDEIAVSFDHGDADEAVGMRMYQNGFAFELPRKGVELEPDPPLAGAQRYVGKYSVEDQGTFTVLLKENNRLAVDVPGQMAFELRPPDEDGRRAFRVSEDFAVTFDTDDAGRVVSMTMTQPGDRRVLMRVTAEDETPLPTLDEVFALRRVEERERALTALLGLRCTGSVRFASSGLEGTSTTIVGGHDRYRIDMDFGPFGALTMAVLGPRGWTINPVHGFEEQEGVPLRQLALDNPAVLLGDWRRHYASLVVDRTDELDGRPTIVVVLENEGVPASTVHLDAETGDLLKSESVIVQEPLRIPVTTTFGDFREVGGIRLPHRVTSKNEHNGRTVMRIESYETGLALDEKAFRVEDPAKH